MEYFVNCNTAPLTPYAPPLDKTRVEHLFRRAGFSASVQTVDQSVGQTAGTLVDSLVNDALALPPLPAPAWQDWNRANYPADDDAAGPIIRSQRDSWRLDYTQALLDNNLRDRMSFFWSNHFVTELEIYESPSYLYYYTDCLQRNALGNFKTFVSEIGLTYAMLYYLDGVYNNGDNPNENYARELYELFTLGEGNGYTEQDIIETARALSGYTERGEERWDPVIFDITTFDPGVKTILGQSGTWGYDDVIDILFEQRPNEIATFICRKIYEFLVHPDSNDATGNAEAIISGMATTFISNNFELAPVVSQLLKSQHFFDDNAIGVIIKSPFDYYLNFINETGFGYDDTNLSFALESSRLIGQELFEPVDVAGWQRDRQWINTNFIIGRWLTIEVMIQGFFQANQEQFRTLAMDAVGPADSNTSNPETVVRALVDKFLPKGLLTPQDFENAMDVFKIDDVPENYYGSDNIPGGLGLWMLAVSPEVPQQVFLLLMYLSRQPEFQLK
ncbi:DUF1800 domain-containing protein [Robiginitalea biformata]|uniref:Probable signal peptide protein n=1 Tax=Robiginitalea biformata (strain ATCC BAA-864 / DSM 15991 / KCTC 12146 / HTCC2501) TaxID=313596 RepID=A4CH48_ROBBH|nr:DUF1800 domain-containing protein [Robiginitalea biformata]EAR16256.1 probable signal peptide protein [Robiginitalea biformata HTCC2501]